MSDAKVHAMCGYLQERCNKCPREIDTAYGRGTQGCFAIAEETLQKAREIDRRSMTQEERESVKRLLEQAADALEASYDATEWPANGQSRQDKAALAIRRYFKDAARENG